MSMTPTSDSNTTSADTPPASSSASPQSLNVNMGSDTKRAAVADVHPEYQDGKVLLISARRPRSFFERTVRELLAGGTDVIILSALGDAIPLCVQLQSSLEEKKAAKKVKIETTYNQFGRKPHGTSSTAGLRIYMKKHEEFKGSRISPGYVSFAECRAGHKTPIFDEDPKERFGSVNCGDPGLYVGGSTINKEFAEVLSKAGQDVGKYEALHKALLEKGLKDNEGNETDADVRAVQLEDLEKFHSDLKLAICRPCKSLSGRDPLGPTGAVFISVFKDSVVPFGKEKNMAMVYVVGPSGRDFDSRTSFLGAVKTSAVNLMTCLCDYNGIARRQGTQKHLQKLATCRVALFSGGAFIREDVTKRDVAQAILAGLEEGYRHGPAPRLNFSYDQDVFKEVWTQSTGLDVYENASAEEAKQ